MGSTLGSRRTQTYTVPNSTPAITRGPRQAHSSSKPNIGGEARPARHIGRALPRTVPNSTPAVMASGMVGTVST